MTDAERAALIANMSPDQRAAYLASLSFSHPPLPHLSLSVSRMLIQRAREGDQEEEQGGSASGWRC